MLHSEHMFPQIECHVLWHFTCACCQLLLIDDIIIVRKAMYVTTNVYAFSSSIFSLINVFFQGHLLKIIAHDILTVVAVKIIVF
jgi:hypothetical protein